MDDVREKITQRIEQYLNDRGLDLVEVMIRYQKKAYWIDLLTDHRQGGITIAQCGRVNKDIVRIFEEEQILSDDFVLEVSSPGIDRPIVCEKDFSRKIGKEIMVSLKEPVNEKTEYQGVLVGLEAGQGIVIKTKSAQKTFAFSMIEKAKQVI